MSPPADKRGPPETDFSTELAERLDDAPTDDRVYRVALELVEPTRVATVADRADCSKTAARRHLDRLADIGLLTRVMDGPAAYRRNESYFEWRRFDRLASLSEEESNERLRSLLAEHADYRDEFEVDEPADVDPLEYDDSETIWLELEGWKAVRTEIRDLRRAKEERSVDEGIA
ncbi:hypothetical protein Halru_1857 [Halovivax ruber XH-70]|uniref:Transcriptional regulator n=1 Tax=Halovivax ruber (strain DSM 18193 / JCM 13892 / XH-70) TaxID=797302 RepID=L0IE12_HALRX|nr:hypothetical protein [Halovivax ruber]AGB16456.1 hypothetical protein Halru_1857 [Halovivax ruber XH-70]